MEYRIKHIPQLGYWVQVNKGWFQGWNKIGRHVYGFGLYDENDLNHPLQTEEEARQLIKEYDQWLSLINLAGNTKYISV